MKMNKLATLLLTSTLTLAGGAAWAAGSTADTSANNGQANSSAAAGQTAPDAQQNLAPKGVDNSKINNGSTNSASGTHQTHSSQHMSKDEVHKNTMCKDGRCPDVNKKVQTGNGTHNDADTKTDGTTQ
ncbi:YbgS-like family protein [Kosakonia oryziphila]|uniref:YbgS-like protein n=1 Tax=Kosakonia oryziphila TaxID=1005667 RepID=A0A1C4A1G9_9ENTR|nr:YbgS-like family protein [Kosakonia oryziphila]SCB88385.1 YbgS-like protein [Kosakonia oryziphila]